MDNDAPIEKKEKEPADLVGCAKWGCLSTFIISVILLVVSAILARNAGRAILEKLSDEPADIPVYQASPSEVKSVNAKLDAIHHAVSNNHRHQTSFTAEELNTIIASRNEASQLRGKAYFNIEENRLKLDVCYSMKDFEPYKDKYLNGSILLKISSEKGRLVVNADETIINGEKLPGAFTRNMLPERMLDQLYSEKNSDAERFLKRIKNAEIKGNQLHFETYGDEPPKN